MKLIRAIFKVIFSSIVATILISCFLCFYYILPAHKENELGNTDFVWTPNAIWVRASEGISFGRFDENGFNNRTIIENPDIIVLGSSHMEATYVMQDECMTSVLDDMLDGRYSVYNMGISGHDLFKICHYLPISLNLYSRPPRYVIIETYETSITNDNVNSIFDENQKNTTLSKNEILSNLQTIPFFRLLYYQLRNGLLQLFLADNSAVEEVEYEEVLSNDSALIEDIYIDEKPYEEFFCYVESIEHDYDCQVIICYHPTEVIMKDGTIGFQKDAFLDTFKKYAYKHKIDIVDLTERLMRMHEEDFKVAHGFCTGELASGHLNRYGHYVMADELYKEIVLLESDK